MEQDRLGATRSHLRVLVVEDEPMVALDVRHTLEDMGLEPIAPATRAREALALALVEKPDLLFMDVGLAGEMDGITTAEAIVRALQIPVVFFTGLTSEDFRSRAKQVPQAVFLAKPANAEQIRAAVAGALALAGRLEALTNAAR